MSRTLARRRDLLWLAPLSALALALGLLVPLLSRGSRPSLADSTGPRMALAVSGGGVVCSASPEPACSVPGGESFTAAVDVVEGPAEGYIGFQTELFYDGLTYQPLLDLRAEITWPESALSARFPAAPLGHERIVDHGALSAASPPFLVSTHTGQVVAVQLACPATVQTFTLALLPYDSATRLLGAGFKPAGSGGEAGPSIPAKTSGQRALDLAGNGVPAQINVADALRIDCGVGTPGPTNTPQPARTLTPTITATPTVAATRTATPPRLLGDVNCDAAINSVDAALVLQLGAGLIEALSCAGNADVNNDGHIDSIDAALILQFEAGLLHSLPP